MHYMPWYETPHVRDKWGSHWTGHQKQHDPSQIGPDGLPDIWSHLHPLIGLYDSTDPDVIECQLLQMKLAGIDGVIVDWYGIASVADYPPIHEATKAMFEACARLDMSFSVCFEDRTIEYQIKTGDIQSDEAVDQLTDTIQWCESNWFASEHYQRIDGKPLFLNFGPIYVKDSDVWSQALASVEDRPAFVALHHLWKKAGGDGGFTWVHKDAWKEDGPEAVKKRLEEIYAYYGDADEMIVSAYPGFKDVYANSFGKLDHRDGKTLEESLDVCMKGPWQTIQLVTWNDYGEGTCIEPTHEFGYRFLEIIQAKRRAELGETFAYTPDDLKLPARLLKLRQAGISPKEDLDAIAQLLAAGWCEQARERIERLEKS